MLLILLLVSFVAAGDLLSAIGKGNVEEVKRLAKSRDDLDQVLIAGQTAVQLAIAFGRHRVLDALLEVRGQPAEADFLSKLAAEAAVLRDGEAACDCLAVLFAHGLQWSHQLEEISVRHRAWEGLCCGVKGNQGRLLGGEALLLEVMDEAGDQAVLCLINEAKMPLDSEEVIDRLLDETPVSERPDQLRDKSTVLSQTELAWADMVSALAGDVHFARGVDISEHAIMVHSVNGSERFAFELNPPEKRRGDRRLALEQVPEEDRVADTTPFKTTLEALLQRRWTAQTVDGDEAGDVSAEMTVLQEHIALTEKVAFVKDNALTREQLERLVLNIDLAEEIEKEINAQLNKFYVGDEPIEQYWKRDLEKAVPAMEGSLVVLSVPSTMAPRMIATLVDLIPAHISLIVPQPLAARMLSEGDSDVLALHEPVDEEEGLAHRGAYEIAERLCRKKRVPRFESRFFESQRKPRIPNDQFDLVALPRNKQK